MFSWIPSKKYWNTLVRLEKGTLYSLVFQILTLFMYIVFLHLVHSMSCGNTHSEKNSLFVRERERVCSFRTVDCSNTDLYKNWTLVIWTKKKPIFIPLLFTSIHIKFYYEMGTKRDQSFEKCGITNCIKMIPISYLMC